MRALILLPFFVIGLLLLIKGRRNSITELVGASMTIAPVFTLMILLVLPGGLDW